VLLFELVKFQKTINARETARPEAYSKPSLSFFDQSETTHCVRIQASSAHVNLEFRYNI